MFFSRVAVSALSKRSLVAGSRFAVAPWVQNVCWLSSVHVPPLPTSNHIHKPLTNPGAAIIYTEKDGDPALANLAKTPVANIEDNTDRRAAPLVGADAQKNPPRVGLWTPASRTHVAHMKQGDFYGSEISACMKEATDVIIEFIPKGGSPKVLKESTPLEAGEVIDASFMSVRQLVDFYEEEIEDANNSEILFSLHLKASMMKVSDPIMFGHCIRVFYKDAFAKHGDTLAKIGANPNNGLASIFEVVGAKLEAEEAKEIIDDFNACYEGKPWLAMVNSDKGITNLHAPNDIIIDASMPVVIRDSGKMWNKLNELEDTKCVIPDRCYATIYQECISYVKTHGQVRYMYPSSEPTCPMFSPRASPLYVYSSTSPQWVASAT